MAQKNGLVKVFDSLSDPTPSVVTDLQTETDDYWDRGLLGMALDPNFPATPFIYLLYTYDAPPGQVAPIWNDACPTPPGPTTDGCLAQGKLVRVQLVGDAQTGSPTTLISGEWCQQYPSHSIGDLNFGPDGMLYVSGGDGASFNFVDWGQGGGSAGSPTPKNPCGDPPAGIGGSEVPPGAQGGALRSQSMQRTSGTTSPSGTELLSNPGVDSSVSNWAENFAAVSLDTTKAHSGAGSLKVVTGNTYPVEGVYQVTGPGSIVPGQSYRVSAWVNAPTGAPLKLVTEWRTSTGAFVTVNESYFSGTGGWAKASFDVVAPAGADHIAYCVYTGNVQQQLTFNLDDASVQQLITGGGTGTGPVLLNGAVLRINPATGLAPPDNPGAGAASANAQRIIAYGFRNPFRFTFRPGTSELWIGDVGADTWEEIDRRVTPTGPVQNFGWPCYEGNGPMPGYQSAGLSICGTLYGSPAGTTTGPVFRLPAWGAGRAG